MRLYQIFLVLIALLFNLANGYFWINPRISSELKKHRENLINHLNIKSDLKKTIDSDDNLNSLTNSVNPIEILPEDFFGSEEPIIPDDGDFVNIPLPFYCMILYNFVLNYIITHNFIALEARQSGFHTRH